MMIDIQRKHSGAFYTPDAVAETLVDWVVRQPDDCLLDPSCGDGRFLACHANAVGVEQSGAAVDVARHRAPGARIHHSDFFAWAEETNERFDCAAGNPPFIRYQRFSGAVRERALRLCGRLGARFTGLSSSWAPFLVATASLLKPGGRMAFVVPAEIGHAPYAVPLLAYLTRSFRRLQVIAVRQKVFPQLAEDTWLLYAEDFGGQAEYIRFSPCEEFRATASPPRFGIDVALADWERWHGRLRPFLLGDNVRDLYQRLLHGPNVNRLGSLAQVGIGYVSGANDFFHFRPSVARTLGIPPACLQATVRNGRSLPRRVLTQQTVDTWLHRDEPILLLRLRGGEELPASVVAYLDSPAGREARGGYKCRNRRPWYVVPDVRIPSAFLTYMSGEAPALVANGGNCTCTNSIHAVHLKPGVRLPDLLDAWEHPLTRLSCELEGHPLGGGMLKLEPREAARIAIPLAGVHLSRSQTRDLDDALITMRRWRHYE